MADNLRISTPLTPNESLSKVRTNKESDPLVTIDPTRVLSKDASSSNTNKSNLEFAFNRGSVFNAFAQKLSDTPALSQTLQKLLQGVLLQKGTAELSNLSNIKGSSFEAMIAKLAQEIKMDEGQMLQNILFQQSNCTSFKSDLFKLLRNIANTADSNSVTKDYIGRFLKAYDGYYTSEETMSSIINQLKDIIVRIPKTYSEEIHNQMGELIHGSDQEAMNSNLKLLKETILPLIGKYVSTTNDMSETREKITLLVNDISRLNISTKEEVVERFSELLDYCKYSLNVESEKIELLNNLFIKEMLGHEVPENKLIDSLMDVLLNSQTEKLSTTSQTMLKDITTALLLDKSAFMPFHHIVLPVDFAGKFMFSEIWVEKDDSNNSQSKEYSNNKRRVFLSFEIQDIGKIQSVIGIGNGNIDCRLSLPDSLQSDKRDIKKKLNEIFVNNGFNVERISSLPKNYEISDEIIKKVYEGRSSINVSIW